MYKNSMSKGCLYGLIVFGFFVLTLVFHVLSQQEGGGFIGGVIMGVGVALLVKAWKAVKRREG